MKRHKWSQQGHRSAGCQPAFLTFCGLSTNSALSLPRPKSALYR